MAGKDWVQAAVLIVVRMSDAQKSMLGENSNILITCDKCVLTLITRLGDMVRVLALSGKVPEDLKQISDDEAKVIGESEKVIKAYNRMVEAVEIASKLSESLASPGG